MKEALLFSGGLDSTALAAWRRPDVGIFIDYGQRPREGEERAVRLLSESIGLPLEVIRISSTSMGSGILAATASIPVAPSPEWWPYRNQLLATVAAGWAIENNVVRLIFGTVATDGFRHADGRAEFYEALDRLISLQEGGLRVEAPAIGLTTGELIKASGVSDDVLVWTTSCHAAAIACGLCPGCTKRRTVFSELGRLE